MSPLNSPKFDLSHLFVRCALILTLLFFNLVVYPSLPALPT